MFSPSIQNLINTGGKDAAIQRAAQINNYVNNLNSVVNAPAEQTVKPFAQVLKTSKPVENRFQISNTKKIENASAKIQKNYSKVNILNMISSISKKHDVDENLVKAVVKQESGFKHDAVSHCGAMGLMQLMPATAKELGVNDPFDPVQNLEGGVKYLKSRLDKYNGNLILALAAYNAGAGNVDKYNGVPPFKETQNYVKNILAQYLG